MTIFRLRAPQWLIVVVLPLAASVAQPPGGLAVELPDAALGRVIADSSGDIERQAAGIDGVQALPEAVFRVPLCDVVDESTFVHLSSPSRAVHMLVGKDGHVQRAVWTETLPCSAELERRAKHWLFRPARDDHDAPVAVWVALPIRRTPCDSLLDRPDSGILEALSNPDSLRVDHVGPEVLMAPPLGNGTSRLDAARAAAKRVRSWLENKRAYEGSGPWVTGCAPVPDWTLVLTGSRGTVRIEIATACDWMQLRQGGRVLFVPYRFVRDDVNAFLASPVWAPARGRAARRSR